MKKSLTIIVMLSVFFIIILKCSRLLYVKNHREFFKNYQLFEKSTEFTDAQDVVPKDAFDMVVFSGIDPSFYVLEFKYNERLPILADNKSLIELDAHDQDLITKIKRIYWRNNDFSNVNVYKIEKSGNWYQYLIVDKKKKYVWFDANY